MQCVAFFVKIKQFLYTYSSIWRMVTSKAKRSAAAKKAARTRKRNVAAKETARKKVTAKRSVATKKRSVATKKRSATKRPVRKASKGKAARRTTRRK